MNNEPKNDDAHIEKLRAEIKKTFPKLSDTEIAYYESGKPNPKFYEAVKTKQNINPDEAEKTVKKLDAECLAACSKNADKSSDISSAPKKAASA